MYLGDEVQVVATLHGGTRWWSGSSAPAADASHDAIRPGDPITIQWDAAAPVLLADAPRDSTEPTEEEEP